MGQRPEPDLFQSSTHSSQVPTHKPGWCSASESLRPFLSPLSFPSPLSQICYSESRGQVWKVITIKTMKKGILMVSSPAYTHTVKDLSVFMGQWKLEPFQLIFASLCSTLPKSSALLSLLELNFLWCTSTCISSSGIKHLNLQVSSAPHCSLKTCCWCAHLPLPQCIVWDYFWNSCPLPQPEGKLISILYQKWGLNTTAWHSRTASIIFQYWALRTPLSWKLFVLLILLCRFSKKKLKIRIKWILDARYWVQTSELWDLVTIPEGITPV